VGGHVEQEHRLSCSQGLDGGVVWVVCTDGLQNRLKVLGEGSLLRQQLMICGSGVNVLEGGGGGASAARIAPTARCKRTQVVVRVVGWPTVELAPRGTERVHAKRSKKKVPHTDASAKKELEPGGSLCRMGARSCARAHSSSTSKSMEACARLGEARVGGGERGCRWWGGGKKQKANTFGLRGRLTTRTAPFPNPQPPPPTPHTRASGKKCAAYRSSGGRQGLRRIGKSTFAHTNTTTHTHEIISPRCPSRAGWAWGWPEMLGIEIQSEMLGIEIQCPHLCCWPPP
jgi:hypothetical protein